MFDHRELQLALQTVDAVWLVVDLADPACAEHLLVIRTELAQRKITLTDRWPGLKAAPGSAPASQAQPDQARGAEELPDPFRIQLPALLIANKHDLDPDPEEVRVFEELTDIRYPAIATSTLTGHGLDELARFVFQALGMVRVYTKLPGRPAERVRPFAVRRGDTVLDVARLVHQDVARTLKFARLWGSGAFDGQQVGPEHRVADGDIVELHAR